MKSKLLILVAVAFLITGCDDKTEKVMDKIFEDTSNTLSLIINSTVSCDNETAQAAVVQAVNNTERYKNTQLYLSNIKMQRIDNLKTYCSATMGTSYGSMPITYTTQKAGFLEVYVEVSLSR